MNDNRIDLQILCIVVIVTVCSYGLALILSITCWNAYKRHKSSDIICSKCCSSPSPQGFVQMNPYQYSGLPQYSVGAAGCIESHTADQRLGFLSSGQVGAHPSFSANLVTSNNPSPVDGDFLDRDTTISRSFRSSLFQSQSSPVNQQVSNVAENVYKMNNDAYKDPFQECNINKMSQVRVLSSPPVNEIGVASGTSASRTPANARQKTASFRRSSAFGSNATRRSFKVAFSRKAKSIQTEPDRDIPVTTETNLDTSDTNEDDEEVFVSNNRRTVINVDNHIVSDNNTRTSRKLTRKVSDWTDPKKGRKVGSPGRTGDAKYFMKQASKAPLRSVDIDIHCDPKSKTEKVNKTKEVNLRNIQSAPQAEIRSRVNFDGQGGAKPKNNSFLRVPSNRKQRGSNRQYRPGYSESEDVTDFTSEDENRQDQKLLLQLPPRGPSPLSSIGDVSVTPPPPESTDVSPEPSPLQNYSPESFTQSEMELVNPTDVGPSSEGGSLQWDDYPNELSFSKS